MICLCAAAPSFAQDKAASAESLRELMTITRSQQLIDGMYGQLDGLMQQATRDALNGNQLNAEQEKIAADMRAKLIALFREEMSWGKLEPSFIGIYQKALTQKEVDGMIAFYKTDAGKAVIEKMPQVMQLSMEFMMELMQKISPRIREISEEMIEKLKAAE
jgi:hypothetical protein